MIGLKFGKLTVIERRGKSKHGHALWLCNCECGGSKIVKSVNLRKGITRSCGCLKSGVVKENVIGQKYGRLMIVESIGMDKWGNQILDCLCDCGKKSTAILSALRSGGTSSCGCYRKELFSLKVGENATNYNPLLTEEERTKRRSIKGTSKWKKEVKSRDNHTCQCCGELNPRPIIAHHLDGFHWNKELRFDVNNGITLCKKCHDSFHKKYGYKRNTKEQFQDFLRWKRGKIESKITDFLAKDCVDSPLKQ